MDNRWSRFVSQVEDELSRGTRGFLSLDGSFTREQDLTQAIAEGLRELFAEFYRDAVSDIQQHVVYRQGKTPQDRQAWTAAKPDKWMNVYGLNFVPDVLIRRTLTPVKEVLPIEVKLVTGQACSQSIATAIGQAIAYSVSCPRSIVFIGLHQGSTDTAHPLRGHREEPTQTALRKRLAGCGISLIVRPVSVSNS